MTSILNKYPKYFSWVNWIKTTSYSAGIACDSNRTRQTIDEAIYHCGFNFSFRISRESSTQVSELSKSDDVLEESYILSEKNKDIFDWFENLTDKWTYSKDAHVMIFYFKNKEDFLKSILKFDRVIIVDTGKDNEIF